MIRVSSPASGPTRLASLVAALLLSGCAPDPGIPNRPPVHADGAPSLVVEGDWDDIGAAVSRASSLLAVAPTTIKTVGDGSIGSVKRFELLSIDGQPATVTVTAEAPWSTESGPMPMRVVSTFGMPNDRARAAALSAEVASGLATLAGRRTAPLQQPLFEKEPEPRSRPLRPSEGE